MGDSGTHNDSAAAKRHCAKCGACTPVCPVFRVSGNEIYSARGKQHLAEVFGDRRPGPIFEDIFSKCLLCGSCSRVCPQHIDISEAVIEARTVFSQLYGEHGYQKYLARRALNRPELLGAVRVLGKTAANILFRRLPPSSGLRHRLALFAQSPQPVDVLPDPVSAAGSAAAPLTYFPGCAAHYLYPDIIESLTNVLARADHKPVVPGGLGCCGLASLASGKKEEARRLAKKNIGVLEQSDGPILVSCGSCYAHLTAYGKLLADDPNWKIRAELISERVVEISVFLQSLLVDEDLGTDTFAGKLRVFYHDPCHMRNEAGITREPRSVLRAVQGIELVELEDGPQCCGQGGLFHVGAPELSTLIRDDLADRIIALEPDVITTTCSGCLMQLKSAMAAKNRNTPVVHLAALINSFAASRLPSSV